MLEAGPVRQSVDDLRSPIQERQRVGDLPLVGREEVRDVILQGVQKVRQRCAHAVVGVVGGAVVAEGKGGVEG